MNTTPFPRKESIFACLDALAKSQATSEIPTSEIAGPAKVVAAVASGSALSWDHPVFYPVECPRCGWRGMSDTTEGGNCIADTGDYDDLICPKCVHVGGRWHGPRVPVNDIPRPNTKISNSGHQPTP